MNIPWYIYFIGFGFTTVCLFLSRYYQASMQDEAEAFVDSTDKESKREFLHQFTAKAGENISWMVLGIAIFVAIVALAVIDTYLI